MKDIPMSKMPIGLLVALVTALNLSSFAGAADAQSFSAEIVSTDAGGLPAGARGRLNVANGMVRIETPEVGAGFFIVSGDASTAYFVRPAQRVFMEARQSSRLTQIFVPLDPDNPCPQWQATARLAGTIENGAEWHCERIGADVVDERDAIVYRAASPRQKSYRAWIDRKLRFPTRIRSEDGATVEIKNIEITPQPANLFEIPADYRKFDPQQLIDRIKQSDVWVEPMR